MDQLQELIKNNEKYRSEIEKNERKIEELLFPQNKLAENASVSPSFSYFEKIRRIFQENTDRKLNAEEVMLMLHNMYPDAHINPQSVKSTITYTFKKGIIDRPIRGRYQLKQENPRISGDISDTHLQEDKTIESQEGMSVS